MVLRATDPLAAAPRPTTIIPATRPIPAVNAPTTTPPTAKAATLLPSMAADVLVFVCSTASLRFVVRLPTALPVGEVVDVDTVAGAAEAADASVASSSSPVQVILKVYCFLFLYKSDEISDILQ